MTLIKKTLFAKRNLKEQRSYFFNIKIEGQKFQGYNNILCNFCYQYLLNKLLLIQKGHFTKLHSISCIKVINPKNYPISRLSENNALKTSKKCQNLKLIFRPLLFLFLPRTRESKRSGENSDIFTLTCTQFPQFLMLHMYIAKRLVLYSNRLKTSKMQNNKSVRALFSAPNHFLHLFFNMHQF